MATLVPWWYSLVTVAQEVLGQCLCRQGLAVMVSVVTCPCWPGLLVRQVRLVGLCLWRQALRLRLVGQ